MNPANTQIVLAATDKGLYRSTDGGQNFSTVYLDKCYDIKLRPGSPGTVYLVKNNPALIKCEFFTSSDTGATFTVQTNGWYVSTDPARTDGGARIAVTPADPNRVYTYLIGEAKANDAGFIGVYRSSDGGQTWTLPNGPDGGPYTTAHPNLAIGTPSWIYWQGFYNCAIMASNTDPDKILIGGLNTWRSDDGGATFSSVSGYVGGPLNMHVDQQDYRATANGYWLTCDGGIYFSNDFYTANYAAKMDGVRGAEYWGFGQGWNEDITTGGLYHNGNTVHHENYSSGTNLQIGGGEPASGYINPGENKRVMSSDVGGAIIPAVIGQPINWFSVGMFPNESYWAAESSEMEFDPRCYNHIYLGNENKLWKSIDGGGSFNLVNAFGTNINARAHQVEISRSNPDVIYVSQRPASGNTGFLYKTTNGGTNWSSVTLPAVASGDRRRILLALSPVNENLLWIAFASGGNGTKVFKTTDGVASWTNITTGDLDNEEIRSLVHIGGTDGGVYAFTFNTVFYRNNTMSNWTPDNGGLPALLNTDAARPFYRDGKIRVATYGKGIWENALYEQPAAPIAQATVDKLSLEIYCSVDTFYFEDYSLLNHTGASWQWSFPGGSPSSSSLRNPKVVYATPGTYSAYLTVTDGNSQTSSDTLTVTVSAYQLATQVQEGFQNSFPPPGWFMEAAPNGGQWTLSTAAGGFGNSTQSVLFDNYNYDAQHDWADLRIGTNLVGMVNPLLTFDYAYAEYGFPYSDSLQVRVSTDCGASWTTLYTKGGSQLATAPANTSSTFIPAASEWQNDTIDLSAYTSQSNVMIAFRNIGYWGQALYLDNINLNAPNGMNEPVSSAEAGLFPNPAAAGESLTLFGNPAETYRVTLFDASGKKITAYTVTGGGKISLPADLSAGIYHCFIHGDTVIKSGKLTVLKR
ncbi:MAG: putative glycoside hydrolase [Bacteroidetes bacterium]|nr:MAG: putative glycoside hydrolase [Bacteroidota bacterium]